MMREVVEKSNVAPSPTPEEPRLTRELLLETLAMNEDEKQNLKLQYRTVPWKLLRST